MITEIKESLWKQFGASIDMLHNAIAMWPEERWETKKKFFYVAYHTSVFLEYYLTNPPPKNFSAELPFTESDVPVEDSVDDVIPNRTYSKKELLNYLQSSREKCRNAIAGLSVENISDRWVEPSGHRNYSFVELLLYNMRHVQHHAAQLNMMLRQELNNAPRWIARAPGDL
jgi:hypothetical protein